MMKEALKVAAVQFEPTQFAHAQNIAALTKLVEAAAQQGAKLITTPEMATTGYCWKDRAEVAPFVEPIPGPTTAHFERLCKRYDCYVVIGMPEIDPLTGLYYNSGVLVGPQGILGYHRKTHSYISEPRWAAVGDRGHAVVDTPIGRIAILICMDIHFPETARIAGVEGADVICHISNWLAERTPAPYWISRAVENGCYLMESNRWGLERGVQFSGGSCIIAPDSRVIACVDDGDGAAMAEIPLNDTVQAENNVAAAPFAHRRPEMYSALMTNPFVWNPLDYFGLYGISPLPPGRKSRLAVSQFAPASVSEDNLATIEASIKAITADGGADMIVFPERSLTGIQDGEPVTEPVDGPSCIALMKLAIKYRIYLVAGLAEKDGQHRYNTAVLVGPEGLVGKYRQIHLNRQDRAWAQAGQEWKTFDTALGRVGILIGHDLLLPESARVLALSGCDIIACPSALQGTLTGAHKGTLVKQPYPIPTGTDPHHWHHARVRSGENNVYLAFANVGDTPNGYLGKSGVFGPDTFAFPRHEAIVMDNIGHAVLATDTTNVHSPYPNAVVRRKDHLMMRLPHHYLSLIERSD